MSSAAVHFYIYYRIAAPHAADAFALLNGVMRSLDEQFTVFGRLLRAETDADLWMEIYEDVDEPQRFEAAMNALLAPTRFASWLVPGSTRRIERFVTLQG